MVALRTELVALITRNPIAILAVAARTQTRFMVWVIVMHRAQERTEVPVTTSRRERARMQAVWRAV